jgi:pSer/pThr/pTyr-binding forkhead associated (FHA) protein
LLPLVNRTQEVTMAPANFQLVMQSGPTPGKSYPLDKNEIFIGRDINNDIVISDAEISRKHCRLALQGGGYVVEDLGSTNGCFVNGQRLMGPHGLTSGELMMLGENVGLVYEAIGFDINATMVGSSANVVPPFQDLSGPGESAFSAPPVESYGPPQPLPPFKATPIGTSASGYADQAASTTQQGNCRKWALAGCGCLVVIICLLLIIVAIMFAVNPNMLETVICLGPVKGLTNGILEAVGSPYICP